MTTRSPGREVAHVVADLLDDADALVAEDRAGLHAGHRAADHVQVGAADRGGGDADDGVGGFWIFGSGTSSRRISPTS